MTPANLELLRPLVKEAIYQSGQQNALLFTLQGFARVLQEEYQLQRMPHLEWTHRLLLQLPYCRWAGGNLWEYTR